LAGEDLRMLLICAPAEKSQKINIRAQKPGVN